MKARVGPPDRAEHIAQRHPPRTPGDHGKLRELPTSGTGAPTDACPPGTSIAPIGGPPSLERRVHRRKDVVHNILNWAIRDSRAADPSDIAAAREFIGDVGLKAQNLSDQDRTILAGVIDRVSYKKIGLAVHPAMSAGAVGVRVCRLRKLFARWLDRRSGRDREAPTRC